MRAHDTQAGNVAVWDTVGRLLLHFCNDIADNLGVVVGALGGARDVDGDEAELRPRQAVVEVVLEEVVFGEVLEVGVLDQRQIRVAQGSNIHGGPVGESGRVSGQDEWWWRTEREMCRETVGDGV